MDNPPSPLQASARETVAALDELRRYERLSESWGELVDRARRRLQTWEADQQDALSLRAARAAVATAAAEAAQAARFDARLLKSAPHELALAWGELEPYINSLRERETEAAAHLDTAVEGLLTEYAQSLGGSGEARATTVMRSEMRLMDDLGRLLRAYGDNIEQLLLDLGEMVRETFGGGATEAALPTRVPREPPEPKLSGTDTAADLVHRPEQVADAVWGAVERFRAQLDARVDNAIRALRSRLESAGEQQQGCPGAVGERVQVLIRQSHELDKLAQQLDWMLPTN